MKNKIQKLKEEYFGIYAEVNNNEKYKELNKSLHHGITRKDHIDRVGFLSFVMSKIFKLDTISMTRGALLHDFFTDEDIKQTKKNIWHKTHPYLALNNSLKYYDLNELEKNIIESHMFPLNTELPKYKESVLVGIADKSVAVYEFLRFNIKVYSYFLVLFIYCRIF